MNDASFDYQPLRMPQVVEPSGGQVGTGMALVLEATIMVLLEEEEIWEEAAAPVRARTTTNARTMFFMV